MSDETTELPQQTRATRPIEPEEAPERARVCPACGVFNVLARHVCRVCGVDLATGAALPWPEPDPDPETAGTALHERPHPRRWLLALAAVLAAAGLVLIGLVIAGVGPFGDPTSVPSASFDAEVYAEDPARLRVSDIATVSVRPPDGERTYVGSHVVDDTPETAWRSDGLQDQTTEDDPLEIVDLVLDEPGWVDELLIRNGDQLDLEAYEEDGRVRLLRATFDGGTRYLLNLLDEGRGQQTIELPEPELTTMVRLEVLDLFPGSESDGVAISDLEVRGWVAEGEDLELASERAEAWPATAPRPSNG